MFLRLSLSCGYVADVCVGGVLKCRCECERSSNQMDGSRAIDAMRRENHRPIKHCHFPLERTATARIKKKREAQAKATNRFRLQMNVCVFSCFPPKLPVFFCCDIQMMQFSFWSLSLSLPSFHSIRFAFPSNRGCGLCEVVDARFHAVTLHFFALFVSLILLPLLCPLLLLILLSLLWLWLWLWL